MNTRAALDASGRAEAAYMPAPGDLTPFVGGRIDWSVLMMDSAGARASSPVGFDVVP